MNRRWRWQGRLPRHFALNLNPSLNPRLLGRTLYLVIHLEAEFGNHIFVSDACLYFSRSKKMVNNPWGNRGRKKCGACRLRKRSVYPIWYLCWWKCDFDDEANACHFCTTHGGRCGPKVFAEKAKHYRTKPVDDFRGDEIKVTRSESPEPPAPWELQIPQTSVASLDYSLPSHSDTWIEPSQFGINIEVGDIPIDNELTFDPGFILMLPY